jgi:uncharacterized membrane protein YfcA
MLDWLTQNTLLPGDLAILGLALLGSICIGLSKAGLAGTATFNVVLMAKIFGAKPSIGIVLPLLITADIMGFLINRKGGSWRLVLPMVPAAILGVILGWQLLDHIDNHSARWLIGLTILGLLAFNQWLQWREEIFRTLTQNRYFTWGMGFLGGSTTMLANAAGPIMTVYFLAQRWDKKTYLGVFSRFFLFINLFKLPFSRQLGLVNTRSLNTNLVLLPGVVLGIFLGWWILQKIPQKYFEKVLTVLTALAAVWLILSA